MRTFFRLTTFCLAAWLPLAAAAATNARAERSAALRSKADIVHGAALFAQCTACHGADGRGGDHGSTPKIAGQHYLVVVNQLIDFRYGKRWDNRMEGMADQHHLAGPQDIADVAVYVSALESKGAHELGSGEFVAVGQAIYLEQCQSCHGAHAEGDARNAIPRLAGQHYGYLMRQMYDAVDGRRPTLPRSHSQRIKPLDFQQVRGLADFLARLPDRPSPVSKP